MGVFLSSPKTTGPGYHVPEGWVLLHRALSIIYCTLQVEAAAQMMGGISTVILSLIMVSDIWP